jgi:hypothetical protein
MAHHIPVEATPKEYIHTVLRNIVVLMAEIRVYFRLGREQLGRWATFP